MSENRPSSPKSLTDQDRLVGQRITALRKARGLSQTALGQAIGVTFQQVQKYEKGQNRVGAGRLHEIAHLLGVPISALFEEMPRDDHGVVAPVGAETPDANELARIFATIADEEIRRSILVLTRALARGGKGAV